MTMRAMRAAPALLMGMALGACSGGGLGDILGGVLGGTGGTGQAQSGVVTVEVQEVRQQSQEIIVRTQDGQTGPVLFDGNTQVVYNNENYPVTALERGDVVDMRVQQIEQGYYTDLIQVRESVQERQGGTTGTGTASDVYRVEGTIASIDTSRGMFTLNMTQGGTVPVYLPSNASTSMRDQLRDYRAGDYVRVEIRPIDEQNTQLVRWGWS